MNKLVEIRQGKFSQGREINIITRAAGYSQLINRPTHNTKDTLSCIDLIFTSNPNLISSSDVEMSLFEECHHNIMYSKIDFKIPSPPLGLQKCLVHKVSNVMFLVLTGFFYSTENLSTKRWTY